MEKNNLLAISLLFSIIGIFNLLIISMIIEPEKIQCSELNKTKSDYIEISGKVEKIIFKENYETIYLNQNNCKFQVTCFCNQNFSNNVEIIGKIDRYRSRMTIIADKIR